jgi:NAD(P)-dependent dehydrogenase (short-subunit alcohol dehydrogenase family)
MDYGMKGNVALVTGATSGIGREAAKIFAAEGCKVVCSGRNEERGLETVKMIHDAGGEAIFFAADVTDEAQVKALVDFAVNTYGKLDYAFNNAGIAMGAGGPLHTVPQEKFDIVMGTNFYGVLYCMRYELAYMDKAGKGAIVNTCSINSIRATRFGTPYTSSKYALYGLTRATALDYAEKGIRINAIGPGVTDTPMIAGLKKAVPEKIQGLIDTIPDKKMGTAANQANMAVYLCSDLAEHITAELIVVDGGQNANM